jgi:hypothetical protein
VRVKSEELVLVRPTIVVDATQRTPRVAELQRLLDEPLTMPLGSMRRPLRVSQTPLARVSVGHAPVPEENAPSPGRARRCASAACDAVPERTHASSYQARLAEERAESAAKLVLASEGFTERARVTREKIASAVKAVRSAGASVEVTARGRRSSRAAVEPDRAPSHEAPRSRRPGRELEEMSSALPRARERLRSEQRVAFAARERARLQTPTAVPRTPAQRSGVVDGWQALPHKPKRCSYERRAAWLHTVVLGTCSMLLAYWLTWTLTANPRPIAPLSAAATAQAVMCR